jgi:hypothetical protein
MTSVLTFVYFQLYTTQSAREAIAVRLLCPRDMVLTTRRKDFRRILVRLGWTKGFAVMLMVSQQNLRIGASKVVLASETSV